MDRNWKSLCEVVGAWSQSKGWRDKPRNWFTQFVNFHGELSEAWEEFRARRWETWFNVDYAALPDEEGRMPIAKPEGLWVELGDLVIRIADTVEANGWQNQELPTNVLPGGPPMEFDQFAALAHAQLAYSIIDGRREDQDRLADMLYVVAACFSYAEQHGVDLWEAIELKHKYNQTRPYRHGSKVA